MNILLNIKIKVIKMKLESLNQKYFAVVASNWKENNYSPTVWFYPRKTNSYLDSTTVSFSKGLELGLNYAKNEKELVLAFFDKKDIDLITQYITCLGYDRAILKV